MSKDLEHGAVGFHLDDHAVAIVGQGEVTEAGGSSSTQVDDVRFGREILDDVCHPTLRVLHDEGICPGATLENVEHRVLTTEKRVVSSAPDQRVRTKTAVEVVA